LLNSELFTKNAKNWRAKPQNNCKKLRIIVRTEESVHCFEKNHRMKISVPADDNETWPALP
jgi:hypothetical protein